MLLRMIAAMVPLMMAGNLIAQTQKDYNDYAGFDFVPGETILFDDNMMNDKPGAAPMMWTIAGGKASIATEDNAPCISIDEYYTKLLPKLKNASTLPDTFTIEYDTWLDAGYDGNPGIEIHLMNGDNENIITPNKHELTVSIPGQDAAAKDNPEEYFGENKFYNRWVHISIAEMKKHLVVYLDHYKQIDIADCSVKAQKIAVTGNQSSGMKILLKNFKVAKNIPVKTFEVKNGKFITHAIKFDVNKAIIKPESMSVLKEIANYLVANAAAKFEIGGHTDSDGDDAGNMKLSQQRADAVKAMLVSLGAKETQLMAKGYGETKPIDNNTTPEGKANNRRVEFTEMK
ncbi:MAG TPA: OmpA family protein [Panacibacter sp.]|nr:OmpA family protein [Panacibacter sp.]